MPTEYAHYRFGAQVIPTLPKDLQRSVGRFRRLFDMGLHGPDPFFHYNIFRTTPVGKLGNTMHMETGEVFFTRACRLLRRHPSEAGTVFLYGFLGHYCLDSICHPFVHAHTDQGPIGHVELEKEFDRYLLEKDGKTPPHAQDFSDHMRLSRNEAATAAELLGVTPGQFYRTCHNMALNTRLLAKVNPGLVSAALKHMDKEIAAQQMPDAPNPSCSFLDGEFLQHYDRAVALYPEMARQLTAHIRSQAPFGEEFSKIYG